CVGLCVRWCNGPSVCRAYVAVDRPVDCTLPPAPTEHNGAVPAGFFTFGKRTAVCAGTCLIVDRPPEVHPVRAIHRQRAVFACRGLQREDAGGQNKQEKCEFHWILMGRRSLGSTIPKLRNKGPGSAGYNTDMLVFFWMVQVFFRELGSSSLYPSPDGKDS